MSSRNTMSATSSANAQDRTYIGFWLRLLASLIDTLLLLVVLLPFVLLLSGGQIPALRDLSSGISGLLLNYVYPAVVILLFWFYKSATPGKFWLNATIIDEKTGLPPSKRQLLGRYLAYYLSLLPLGLGFLWIIWDPKKQAWHDKLAGTCVVNTRTYLKMSERRQDEAKAHEEAQFTSSK